MASPTEPHAHQEPAANDEATQAVPTPAPSDVAQANAGRILAEMLGESLTGLEHEGDSVGLYRLCGLLGEGGFGNVWHAEQTEVIRREVALKLVKPGMDSAQVLGRFSQERQALASLEHPNIAKLLDAGMAPSGRPYFAMELVRGGPVTEWCRASNASLEERLRLFIQICHAVQHAHEKGILHRDLKPTNILVTNVAGQPVPKVIDFGVAKALHATSQEALTLLTQADQAVGTPLYMSPEQIEGGRELDARSDVYALGVVLYELLTDTPPFLMEHADMRGLKQMIQETVPERPSTRARQRTGVPTQRRKDKQKSLAASLSQLPTDLDWITLRALEKDRQRRYASAAELAADVQRHLDSQPVLARPPSLAYTAGRWLRRHRKACLAGAAVILCSAVAAGVSMYWARPVREIPFPPPLPAEEVARRSVTNSLGMKFVPVPGIEALFCIHETRRRDYAAYAAAVPGENTEWKDIYQNSPTLGKAAPGPKDDHPVVMVSWEDANRFCEWLSRVEGRTYRLPTDAEWSAAAGVRERSGAEVPPSKRSANPERLLYPWGTHFPPRTEERAGNYADEAWAQAFPGRSSIPGYNDGFPATAPVMSFKASPYGLYDMGGNVSEACAEWLDDRRHGRVYRGSAFHTYETAFLLASERTSSSPAGRYPGLGFRCVLDVKASPAAVVSQPAPAPAPALAKQTGSQSQPLTNSLGMKFVPVPGTKVLFCIHETRRQDYEMFAATVPWLSTRWKNVTHEGRPAGHLPDHPVVGVNWHDANAFCAWLCQKEGRTYRLPADREWSLAVGLSKEEEEAAAGLSPEQLGGLDINHYPWGGSFPPRSGDRAGNYADTVWHETFPERDWIAGYTDGHATTAPVMSFKPNAFGIYDLGGNAYEWCMNPYSTATPDRRVTRSCSYHMRSSRTLRSNHRGWGQADTPSTGIGFRCVLVPGGTTPPSAP
ncbi:MAG: SUMF1/EgtB/PvdO family nonheme iron enzyme [Prosthecobacter sp.]